jgi:ABC-2 type transport system permease protein
MSALTGTGKLIRLILRRDRLLLPLWVVLFAILPLSYASAIDGLYPTAEKLQEYYDSMAGNPTFLSLYGPLYEPNLGAFAIWRSGFLLVLIGLVSLLTVIRHTRTEEDAGRRELLGATVLGRHAPLAAALALTVAANLALGTIIAVEMIGYGLPAVGSVAAGLSFAATGAMFATVGAVAAQLTAGAGAARGIAITVLGGAYLLRSAGDSGGAGGDLAWLSWMSPIGWVQRVRPYAGEQWWVFALIVGCSVALAWAAAALLARRDVGAGILPARLGPATASSGLRSPLALAWRLQRGLLLAWSVGFAVVGLVIGGSAASIDNLAGDSTQLGDLIERLGGTASLKDAYLAGTLGLLGLIGSAYAVQAALRLRTEEAGLRVEPLLATSISRLRWTMSHLLFALLGPAVALAVLGVATGLASVGAGDLGGHLTRVLGGAMVQLPAVWVLAAIAVAAFGLLPRLMAGMSWAAVALCFFLGFVGQLLQLDQRVLDVTPFAHVPKIPGGEFTAAPMGWLLAIAVLLTIAGLAGFRRRDIVSSA